MIHLFPLQGIRGRGMQLLGMGPWNGGFNPLVVQAPQSVPAVADLPLPLQFRLFSKFFTVGNARAVSSKVEPTFFTISGVTKDSLGAILAGCTVTLFRTSDNVPVDCVTSDANGAYVFRSASASFTYYVVAYLAGSPDVAGTTVNTIVGTG